MVAISEAMRAIRFFSPPRPCPFEGYRYVDFRSEEDTAIAAAEEAVATGTCRSILVFGFPGNGRRAFAQRVAGMLFEDKGFHVLWLDIPGLAARQGEAVGNDIEQVEKWLNSLEMRPLLVVANGIDRMNDVVKSNGAMAGLKRVVASFARGGYEPPLLLLATATSPGDAARFIAEDRRLIYFGWPSLDKAAELLDLAGMSDSEAVGRELLRLAHDEDVLFTTGSLVNGGTEAALIAKHLKRLPKMSVEKRARVTFDLCSPTVRREAIDYEAQWKSFIDEAAKKRE
jgi:hypothetical protein